MASFAFNSTMYDESVGVLDYDTDTYKVMLLTSTATPNKDSWTKRSDVTNEVTGTGYTAGGKLVTFTVNAVDTSNDRVDITLGGTSWTAATVTARYAIYYKSRGGASSADELVACVDFGADVISTGSTFTLGDSTLRKSNP